LPIPISGSAGTTEVPAGIQTEFRITDCIFDENNQYGPSFELDLELTDEKFLGTSMKYWARVQQPRLDKVRRWRQDGLDDETISSALRKQGFKFKKMDEPDIMQVGRSSNLYKILTAAEGSTKGAEAVLRRCDSFKELAEALIDGSFIGTTKRSVDGKYVKLDGKEEIFPVASVAFASQKATEVELDALPEFSPEEEKLMNKAFGGTQ
jgi:hypothetical protein